MAQERNPVDASASDETAEIKHEIERTRAEMSETLGEIQDRLRPDHLLEQARDGVTSAAAGKVKTIMNSAGETASTMASRARSAGTNVADYALAHPLYVAVAVGAFTWWMLRGRGQSQDWYAAVDTQWDDDEAMSYGNGRSLRNRVGEYASTARETVGEYASTARETVGEYAQTARSGASRAGERVRSAASSTASSVDDWVHDNPMAAGAIALAIGAAIGLSAPRTEWEDGTLGETRDRAFEQASRAAANLKDTVTQKVATAAENLVGESIANAATGTPSEPMGRA